jgi:hypothetical protein
MNSQAVKRQLAVEVLREELEQLSFNPCGYNHHYNKGDGYREGATCSKEVRDVRLLCAHPDEYGLGKPLAAMQRLGYLTDEQLKVINKYIANEHRRVGMGDVVVDMLARRAFNPGNPYTEWTYLLDQLGFSKAELPNLAPHTKTELPLIAKSLQSKLGRGLAALKETMLIAIDGHPRAGEQIFETFIVAQNANAQTILPTELFNAVMNVHNNS